MTIRIGHNDAVSTRLAAEALCATRGIWPESAPTITDLLAAEGIIGRWRGMIDAWLSGPQRPMTWASPPDQPELQSRLAAPLSEPEVAGWMASLGDIEVGVDYFLVLQQARAYLNAQWPRFETGGVIPEVLPLSQDDYAEVWSLVRVVDSPEVLFEELASYTLTPSQVAAWKACYPELSAVMDQALDMAMVERIVKTPLTWQQEDMIRILRGLAPEAQLDVVKQDEGGGPQKQSPKDWGIDFKATRTQSEQLMARGAAR